MRSIFATMARNDEWYNIWQRAFANTPRRKGFHRHEVRDCERVEFFSREGCTCDDSCIVGVWREPFVNFGKYSAMCRLFDLPIKSSPGWVRNGRVSTGGKHVGHLRIEAAMYRGSVPRNPETRRKLQLLASPFGPVAAWKKLEKLGIAHRYVKPW